MYGLVSKSLPLSQSVGDNGISACSGIPNLRKQNIVYVG